MRKLILLAVAGYLWKKFIQKAPATKSGLNPFRR